MPIWVVAASKAAAQILNAKSYDLEQTIHLLSNEESVSVPIRSASSFQNGEKAIGICNCQSVNCLDITRDMEVWVCLEYFAQDNHVSIEQANCNLTGSIMIVLVRQTKLQHDFLT